MSSRHKTNKNSVPSALQMSWSYTATLPVAAASLADKGSVFMSLCFLALLAAVSRSLRVLFHLVLWVALHPFLLKMILPPTRSSLPFRCSTGARRLEMNDWEFCAPVCRLVISPSGWFITVAPPEHRASICRPEE